MLETYRRRIAVDEDASRPPSSESAPMPRPSSTTGSGEELALQVLEGLLTGKHARSWSNGDRANEADRGTQKAVLPDSSVDTAVLKDSANEERGLLS